MRKKLLLIDDDADIREVASIALEMGADFDVITAESGSAGIALAEAEQPDAILLDYMMPLLNGPATFARLQQSETTRHIPVIFLTAKIQTADRKRLTDLGGLAVLAKPFDPISIGDEIDALLETAVTRS